jgi:MurNAc alpha-1-phosphate uridylyltransferase
MKALLLSAGLGTRLKPFTDHHPKALAMVHGKTLLEYNIRNLQRFGIFDVVVNVHHFAGQIIETLEKENGFGSRVVLSDERDAVLETGGGLMKAAPYFEGEGDLVVMNVDILSNFNLDQMLEVHRNAGSLATIAVMQRESSRYFLFDHDMLLRGWENVKTGEEKIPGGGTRDSLRAYAFSGIHILKEEILGKITREGKFSLVDVYLDLCVQNKIQGWDHTGDLLLDIGKPESIAKAEQLFTPGFYQ